MNISQIYMRSAAIRLIVTSIKHQYDIYVNELIRHINVIQCYKFYWKGQILNFTLKCVRRYSAS